MMRPPRPLEVVIAVAFATVVGAVVGRARSPGTTAPAVAVSAPPPSATAPSGGGPPAVDAGSADASVAGYTVDDDHEPEPPAGTTTDVETLISLVPMTRRDDASIAVARRWLGHGSNHANQGNPEISTHPISREQCKEGLRGVVLQTTLDREICGGPWEVPVHTGDARKASACIDVFEYPNRPCVIPFVFSHPIAARQLCELQGKRLCTQEEWNTACEADPNGGPPRKYAYGDELDLSVCHTGKQKSPRCDVDRALFKTCSSDTVPAGSYPQCRSRLGVYDQHGNVAEAMTRLDKGVNYVQLKGSAFFYDGEMYADHCRFDPRWHVDPVSESWHTNYHLGFRCCRTVTPLDDR